MITVYYLHHWSVDRCVCSVRCALRTRWRKTTELWSVGNITTITTEVAATTGKLSLTVSLCHWSQATAVRNTVKGRNAIIAYCGSVYAVFVEAAVWLKTQGLECCRDLSDGQSLANQHAQTRHVYTGLSSASSPRQFRIISFLVINSRWIIPFSVINSRWISYVINSRWIIPFSVINSRWIIPVSVINSRSPKRDQVDRTKVSNFQGFIWLFAPGG